MPFAATIRARREAFGFSPEALAKLARVSPARLLALETGAPPTTAEVAALGAALVCDPAGLISDRMDDPRRSVARFRSAPGMQRVSPLDLRLLARGAEVGRICARLRQMLGEKPSPVAELLRITGVAAGKDPRRSSRPMLTAGSAPAAPARSSRSNDHLGSRRWALRRSGPAPR